MDARKGKTFTKLSRDIIMACRQGGADPDANFRLKDAILRAREASMPRDNIDRLLEKARGGGEGNDLDEIVYEGYGPDGVAIMVEAATNNRNRTAAEIRLIFSKNAGNIGESGCVGWLFERKGLISGPARGLDEERLMELAIEAGADDVEIDGDIFTMICEISVMQEIRIELNKQKIEVDRYELTMIPKTTTSVSAETAPQLLKLIDLLEDHDDVNQVHSNFDLPAEVLEALEA